MTVAARPSIPAERYAERLRRLGELAAERGLEGVVIGGGPALDYLTGYRAMPLERLTALAIGGSASEPTLVVPRLELAAAEAGVVPELAIQTWEETDDPYRLVLDVLGASPHRPTLAVSDRLTAMHLLRLQERLPDARWVTATGVIRDLRMRKDADEIALLRLAAQAADRVVEQIASGRLVGRTVPMSRTRSGNGSSPKATSTRSSRSSPRAPTRRHRTTRRPSG